MAVTYFPKDADTDATCNAGAGTIDADLSTTQGSSTTIQINAAGDTSYTEESTYDIALAARDGTSYDISVDITASTSTNIRWRVQEIDSGCGVVASSAYATYEPASVGIQTDTLTLAAWTTGTRLRLSIETQEASDCGNRKVTYSVNDSDTWVLAPDPVASTRRVIVVS